MMTVQLKQRQIESEHRRDDNWHQGMREVQTPKFSIYGVAPFVCSVGKLEVACIEAKLHS
ncbi:hypothetical protein NIES4071_108830 (plasmid) [Calothrix sp. NIES-4071]|nr:hypothetical protein NIES4071_108830 [Calothrix sp. NIES-4071]BAZ65105.1 hypothetical protein NIES4105_108380 [Calothrix sp. NIES-4105]